MGQRGLRVNRNAYFAFLTHTNKLLLLTFCDPIAKTGVSFWTERTGQTEWNRMDGQTDVKVEIVI